MFKALVSDAASAGWKANLDRYVASLAGEEGCVNSFVAVDDAEVRLYEVWASAEAHQAHLQSMDYRAFQHKNIDLLARPVGGVLVDTAPRHVGWGRRFERGRRFGRRRRRPSGLGSDGRAAAGAAGQRWRW